MHWTCMGGSERRGEERGGELNKSRQDKTGQDKTGQDRTRDAEWTPVLFGALEVGKSDADWKVESAGWRQISSCHHRRAHCSGSWRVVTGTVPAPTVRKSTMASDIGHTMSCSQSN